jgi:hypothetical protein
MMGLALPVQVVQVIGSLAALLPAAEAAAGLRA